MSADLAAQMSAAEARRTIETIKSHLRSARARLLDLHRREGWRALGYASFRDCAQAEFEKSASQIYRELTAAQVEEDTGSPIGEMPEYHARILARLESPEDRKSAYERAKVIAKAEGAAAPAGSHIESAVEALRREREVYDGKYRILAHLCSIGDMSVSDARRMSAVLDEAKPLEFGFGIQIIGPPYGLRNPALLRPLMDIWMRHQKRESITMRDIIASQTIAGVPVSEASVSDLNRALKEAQREHIEGNTPSGPEAKIITIYAGTEQRRSARAICAALEPEDIDSLIKALQDERGNNQT